MVKKILSSALALALVFGTAAVLPEGAVSFDAPLSASAENAVFKMKYDANGGEFVSDDGQSLGSTYSEDIEEGCESSLHINDDDYYYYNDKRYSSYVSSAIKVDGTWYWAEKKGYMFAGWVDTETGEVFRINVDIKDIKDKVISKEARAGGYSGSDIEPTKNTSIKAIWSKVSVVTFDANGGKFSDEWNHLDGGVGILNADMTVKTVEWYNNSFLKARNYDPTREGYALIGWKDKATGKVYNIDNEDTIWPETDMQLEAVWGKAIKLTYTSSEGEIPEDYFWTSTQIKKINNSTIEETVYAGKNKYLGTYYWISNKDNTAYVTHWKDKETGKIYEDYEKIIPEKDMTFEAVWNKKVTISYMTDKGIIMPDGGSENNEHGNYDEIRAEGVRSPVNLFYGMYGCHEVIYWTKDEKTGEAKMYYPIGWRLVGDTSGKLYQDGDDFYPTKDETFYCVWDYGWNTDTKGKWYLNSDGTYIKDCTKAIDGKTYNFDKSGYATEAHTHSYTSKVVNPTYDAEGYTLYTCSCGESYKDNITPKLTRTSIAKATVTGLSNKTYTGKAITQTPTVKLGGKTLKSGTDYTVSYKNNKAVGTATVTITGKGAYNGTVSKTFKICPKKTAIKKVTSPKTKQLKVTYGKVSGVTGYQIAYSTNSKFTAKTTKSANAAGTSKTISKLTKGKTYYVKVHTYKTVGKTKYYSGYSAVKKVKVK